MKIIFQGQKAIYEREARIIIDYSSLDEDLKEVVLIIMRIFSGRRSNLSQHILKLLLFKIIVNRNSLHVTCEQFTKFQRK